MYLLLVEDDQNLGKSLVRLLSSTYQVEWARSLTEANGYIAVANHDLVLLDLGLPDGDGVDWLRTLRSRQWTTPVLIVTARDALDDRVKGLDTGADDYIVKPFEPEELLARIRVLLRRQSGSAIERLHCGSLSFSTEIQQFYLDDEPVYLPAMEYQILAVLMHAGARPVNRERLVQQLYGLGESADSNTLDVHIHTLRKRIGKDRIETLRGFGYRLVAQ
jgi:DNA-binding response OmpR family regulator